MLVPLLSPRFSFVARLIAEQLLQLVSSGSFTRVAVVFRREEAPREIKIFTEIACRFLIDGVGAPISALVSSPRIIAHAVQADAQIGRTMVARFASTRLPRQAPLPTAFMAMACHGG